MNNLERLIAANIQLFKDDNQMVEGYSMGYNEGFKEAFKTIDEAIEKELLLMKDYPIMGERSITLKLHQKKIKSILNDMEKNDE